MHTGPPFKTMYGTTMYAADAGGAWVDAVIRTLFGYRPRVCGAHCANATAGGGREGGLDIDALLWRADMPRGDFRGTLHGVRTASGELVTISAGADGLAIVKQQLQPQPQ